MVDEESDQQILENIDQIILNHDHDELDSLERLNYIFEKVDNRLEVESLMREKKRLEKQLSVVSRKLSTSIMEKEGAYGDELKRVMDIQQQLSETLHVCRQARDGFAKSRKDFTCASLGIVASYRRREKLRSVLKSLSTIKTLQQTCDRIREVVEEENDYCSAIQLFIECQKVVNSFHHYKCVNELSSKLQELLELIEEHIDISLSKMCHYFNLSTYASLQEAYRMLGKTHTSMDSLCMHFATAISDKAFNLVHGYVELCCSPEVKRTSNLRKKEFKELCKYITNECFVPCLNDLCKSLFGILLNYKRILYHHLKDEIDDHTSLNGNDGEDNAPSENVQVEAIETQFDQRFIRQKLEHGLGRIWQETQQKLRVLLQTHDISSCSFEELMTILKITRHMMDIGFEFCESQSNELEEALHSKTVNYFKHYHKTRLDELRMYLENESWSVCPVKCGFNYIDLQEFKFLKPFKNRIPFAKVNDIDNSTSNHNSHDHPLQTLVPNPDKSRFFTELLLTQESEPIDSAFDNIFQENEDLSDSLLRELKKTGKNSAIENDGSDTSEDEHDEIDKDSVNTTESNPGQNYSEGPLVTNTSLYVLRLMGKYMQIMFLLRQIAFDILLSIFNLFDYYFYTTYVFFAKEITEIKNNCLTTRLKTCLMRIESSLSSLNDGSQPMMINDHSLTTPIQSMFLEDRSLGVDNLYGLVERLVGIESVIFLSSQLDATQGFFRELIPHSKHSILDQYYAQTVSIAKDLRSPGYMLVAAKSVDFESILLSIENVKWDLREIPSIHNSYVDQLLRELQLFSGRLSKIREHLQVKVPQEAIQSLWSSVLKLANRTFVEGFSGAKKCTPAGRALMQLDFQEFLTKAEKMTSIKPIPERELVEEYIKAYYLMDDALEQWILNRNEYTQRQLASLINSVASEKKAKNRLLSVLESKFESSLNSSYH